jgi:hypothetical protein
MVRLLVARFNGYCRKCRGEIVAGDAIMWYGPKQAVHVECGPQPPIDDDESFPEAARERRLNGV